MVYQYSKYNTEIKWEKNFTEWIIKKLLIICSNINHHRKYLKRRADIQVQKNSGQELFLPYII